MSDMVRASPEELCEAITSVGAVAHANAQSRFGGSGREREVNVWLDGDAGAEVVDGVADWIDAAGYDVTRHGETDTGSIWLEGHA
jgi:hypothetical protein